MNQKKAKTLRSIFASIRPFSEGDSRNRTQLQLLKKRYNQVPRDQRAGFLSEMRAHIKALKESQEAQAQEAATAEATT